MKEIKSSWVEQQTFWGRGSVGERHEWHGAMQTKTLSNSIALLPPAADPPHPQPKFHFLHHWHQLKAHLCFYSSPLSPSLCFYDLIFSHKNFPLFALPPQLPWSQHYSCNIKVATTSSLLSDQASSLAPH